MSWSDDEGKVPRWRNTEVPRDLNWDMDIDDEQFYNRHSQSKSVMTKMLEFMLRIIRGWYSLSLAKRAVQDALTLEANGKAAVMKVRYAQLEIKEATIIKATESAEKNRIAAENRKIVAKIDREAAEETKRKRILEGEGEAKKRALIMNADGALSLKLDAFKYAMKVTMDAYKERNVPTNMIITGGGTKGVNTPDQQFQNFFNMAQLKYMKELGLDLDMSKSK